MSENLTYISIIAAIINVSAFIFSIFQYIDTRNKDQKNRDFDAYHKLIKELVQPDNTNDNMYIDRQAACLYELRHFKRYYPLSYRMVLGLKEKWTAVPNQYPRIVEEINLTLEFLQKELKGKIN